MMFSFADIRKEDALIAGGKMILLNGIAMN